MPFLHFLPLESGEGVEEEVEDGGIAGEALGDLEHGLGGLFRDDIGEPGGAAVGSVGFFGSDVHGEGGEGLVFPDFDGEASGGAHEAGLEDVACFSDGVALPVILSYGGNFLFLEADHAHALGHDGGRGAFDEAAPIAGVSGDGDFDVGLEALGEHAEHVIAAVDEEREGSGLAEVEVESGVVAGGHGGSAGMHGFAVDAVLDVQEALVKLKLNHYNLIITDLTMPKIDGYEFIERLKNDEMYADIPIAVMSSLPEKTALKRLSPYKIEYYISKDNFNQVEFLQQIKRILTKYHHK